MRLAYVTDLSVGRNRQEAKSVANARRYTTPLPMLGIPRGHDAALRSLLWDTTTWFQISRS
jgi:hypothetical protein